MKKRNSLEYKLSKLRFTTQKRIEMYHQIRSMMLEGITIVSVFTNLEKIYRIENKSDPRIYMLGCWRKALEEDGSILKELRHWIPPSEAVMFKVAEETGDWPKSLESLIFQVEKKAEMKKVIAAEMAYPAFLTMLLVAILYGFGSAGVPMLTDMLPVERWPALSMPLYHLSTFIASKIILVLLGIAAFIYLIFRMQDKYIGVARNRLDKIPPFSVYKSMQGASFLISLSALLKSGIPIIESVSIIKKNSSIWSRWKINRIQKDFQEGHTGALSLITSGENSMFERDVRIQIRAYSSLGEMDKAINRIGVVALEITTKNIKTAMGIIKGAMLLFVAASVVWIYGSFIQVSQMASSVL